MSDAKTIIAVALQNALRGDGCVRDVPQTCLADSVLLALHSAGMKVVGRDATPEMVKAADSCEPHATYYATGDQLWTAMFDAALPATQGGER